MRGLSFGWTGRSAGDALTRASVGPGGRRRIAGAGLDQHGLLAQVVPVIGLCRIGSRPVAVALTPFSEWGGTSARLRSEGAPERICLHWIPPSGQKGHDPGRGDAPRGLVSVARGDCGLSPSITGGLIAWINQAGNLFLWAQKNPLWRACFGHNLPVIPRCNLVSAPARWRHGIPYLRGRPAINLYCITSAAAEQYVGYAPIAGGFGNLKPGRFMELEMKAWAYVVALCVFSPVLGAAEIYRCVVDGAIVFSQQPCDEASEEERFERLDELARPVSPQPPGVQSSPADPCLHDWECLRGRHEIDADRACRIAIEQSASIDYRWDTGLFATRFSVVRPGVHAGDVVMAGDRIEFQNALGAWVRHRYHCTWSADGRRVSGLEIEPGRLQ